MNAMSELQALQWSRPTTTSSDAEVAAWYERKAVVLEHLTDGSTPPARGIAAEARHHALRLRSGLRRPAAGRVDVKITVPRFITAPELADGTSGETAGDP